MKLSEIDINELDFSNIPDWPLPVRIFVIALVAVVVLFLGYWFDVKTQLETFDQATFKETELKKKFERDAAKAANLDAYKQQLDEMRQSFGTMLRQLPNKTEVADLLVDVSQTGLASGLEFELFKPQNEIPKDFYAELPISIKVKGTYHEFGEFVSGVAALPRIVTVHDISITPSSGKPDKKGKPPKAAQSSGGELLMELTAKTYRYLDEDEEAANRAREEAATKGKKGKKKGAKAKKGAKK